MGITTVYESWSSGSVVGIRNSEDKVVVSDDAGTLLKFLRYSASQTMRVSFNLDEFIAPILRLLPPDILDRLSKFDSNLSYQGHELYYFPDRLFRVGKSKFYSLREFWLDPPCDNPTMEDTQGFLAELMATFDELNLKRVGGQPVRKITSPIAVFQDSEWGSQIFKEMPVAADIPGDCHDMLEYASIADKKEWVSNHAVGHFEQGVFDYDIQSAYPSIAAQLPDLRDMVFWKSDKLGDRERSALLGFVKGCFVLNPDAEYAHCSPIMASVGALPGNPLGVLDDDCYCIDEIRFIDDNNIGTFNMTNGWFGEAKEGVQPRLPLYTIMNDLFDMRGISILAAALTKSIANSIVGKMIETHADRSYVPTRNDIYHATVLSQARVKVAQFLVDNDVKSREMVAVQTDGVKLLKDIPLTSNGMGSWVNKGSSPLLIVSPYKAYTGNKRPYQMTYATLMGEIEKHPNAQFYGTANLHHITLKQAIRDYDDISKVGEIVSRQASIDLVTLPIEQNREYDKLPRMGKELLSSQCLSSPVVLD